MVVRPLGAWHHGMAVLPFGVGVIQDGGTSLRGWCHLAAGWLGVLFFSFHGRFVQAVHSLVMYWQAPKLQTTDDKFRGYMSPLRLRNRATRVADELVRWLREEQSDTKTFHSENPKPDDVVGSRLLLGDLLKDTSRLTLMLARTLALTVMLC